MAKRYLVTGGTGFIGAAIVRRLSEKGHSVRSLDNDFRGSASSLTNLENVENVTADIRDAAAVSQAAKGVDGVIHLAYVNGTRHFYERPELVLDVAVRGMMNVIDACRAQGVKDLVVASSSEVYQTPPRVPTDETAPLTIPDILNARYSYGGGKILHELMAINYGRTGFDRVSIFRPHNVYGPAMGWEHVIPQLILRANDAIKKSPAGAVPFPLLGDGTQTRAFIHIDDFVDGFMHVLEKGAHLNIYHIGNPEEVTIADVARKIFSVLKREPRLEATPAPAGETKRRCPDIGKLKELGFNPRITLDKGLPDVVAWYSSHSDPQSK